MTRKLAGEGARFLLAGAVNTLASYAVYFVLQLALPYQVAYAIAFAFGVVLSYLMNVRFVFRTKHSRGKAMAFPLVYLAQYAAGALFLAVLVEWLGVPKEIAPLAVIVVTIPLTFALTRWVLRPR